MQSNLPPKQQPVIEKSFLSIPNKDCAGNDYANNNKTSQPEAENFQGVIHSGTASSASGATGPSYQVQFMSIDPNAVSYVMPLLKNGERLDQVIFPITKKDI